MKKKVQERDGSDSCTIMWIYLMPLTFHLKMIQVINLCCVYFATCKNICSQTIGSKAPFSWHHQHMSNKHRFLSYPFTVQIFTICIHLFHHLATEDGYVPKLLLLLTLTWEMKCPSPRLPLPMPRAPLHHSSPCSLAAKPLPGLVLCIWTIKVLRSPVS